MNVVSQEKHSHQSQHLSGAQNQIANVESQTTIDRSDWKINPVLLRRIVSDFGPTEVDLFASHLTT